MKNSIDKFIKEISGILKAKYSDFKGIYFFGSRAAGNFNEYSDYDVVFVFDRKIDWRFEYEVKDVIYESELKHEILLDIKIYSYKDIENPSTPFRSNVKREGIFYGI